MQKGASRRIDAVVKLVLDLGNAEQDGTTRDLGDAGLVVGTEVEVDTAVGRSPHAVDVADVDVVFVLPEVRVRHLLQVAPLSGRHFVAQDGWDGLEVHALDQLLAADLPMPKTRQLTNALAV